MYFPSQREDIISKPRQKIKLGIWKTPLKRKGMPWKKPHPSGKKA